MKRIQLSTRIILVILLIAVVLLAFGLLSFRYWQISSGYRGLVDATVSLRSVLERTQNYWHQSIADNNALSEALYSERQRNDAFSQQIEDIAGTVGRLDKLSKTDRELLQKYSKVYFLNENYVPDSLSLVDKEYIYSGKESIELHSRILPFFYAMVDDATDDGVSIILVSGYRSFYQQASIKGNYTVLYGSGANQFSADQGYSEHQLGTAIDITSDEVAPFVDFDTIETYQWMVDNAYQYGFVLSYPPDNNYYQYEPWHWRFVGVLLATYLYETDQYFYDLDQREVDEYLIQLFD